MLGKVNEYADHLVLKQDKLRERFVLDKETWDLSIELAEKEKADYEGKLKKCMEE